MKIKNEHIEYELRRIGRNLIFNVIKINRSLRGKSDPMVFDGVSVKSEYAPSINFTEDLIEVDLHGIIKESDGILAIVELSSELLVEQTISRIRSAIDNWVYYNTLKLSKPNVTTLMDSRGNIVLEYILEQIGNSILFQVVYRDNEIRDSYRHNNIRVNPTEITDISFSPQTNVITIGSYNMITKVFSRNGMNSAEEVSEYFAAEIRGSLQHWADRCRDEISMELKRTNVESKPKVCECCKQEIGSKE